MSDHRRCFRIILALGLGMMFILLGLVIPSAVRADVGVHPVLPGGSNIQPEGQTPIQMSAEVVTMNVRSATQADNSLLQLNPQAYGYQTLPVWFPAVAEVQADFTMTNPTANDISLTAWFPLASALESVSWELNPDETVPRIASFHVAVAGNPLDYSISELPNPKGADRPPLPWASFHVTFPAGADTNIHINYLLPLTQAIKGRELALYYIFQTGASWAGSIGQAELILNLPYPASDGTIARLPATSLAIPYAMAYPQAMIPAGAVMEGNQARWTWTNFEPTPQDDFSVWLMDPALWQQLQADQAAVQTNPQDGQAWLDLASTYHSLATRSYSRPSIFSASYLSLGLQAYQKAIELLPDDPTPHIGLAVLTLTQYITEANAPAEVMQFMWDQLKIAQDLEAAHPDLAGQGGVSSIYIEDALSYYFNVITSTAETAFNSTSQAQGTETAAFLLTPSSTPTLQPSSTSALASSSTPEPIPSSTATPVQSAGMSLNTGESLMLILVIIIIAGLMVILLILNRLRRRIS